MLQTPVCPRAQHLLRTQILCRDTKNVSDFVQKHFVSATNVSQFAQPKKYDGQQCVLVYQGLKTRAASFFNGFKNIPQKACLLGVQTKVQIVRGKN